MRIPSPHPTGPTRSPATTRARVGTPTRFSLARTRFLAVIGPASRLGLVLAGMGLVAYTDWRIATNISVGYLYLFPLVLAGVTIRRRRTLLLLVLVAAILRELFGSFDSGGWLLLARTGVVVIAYTLVVLSVHRSQQRHRVLAATVSHQRDQLAADLEEAAALQRLLVPQRIPAVPGIDLAAGLNPARVVAGDLYDVLWSESDETLAIVVADVGGKGAAAALLMPVVQATVRRLRAEGQPPDELAVRLNRTIAELTDRPRLISVVYLELSVRTWDVTYVNLGHPPPFIIHPGADDVRWLSTGGPIAGAMPQAQYVAGHEHLDPGESVIMYTDGATEAEDARGDPFGLDRLVRVATERCSGLATRTIDGIADSVEAFRADDAKRDDLTLVALRRTAPALSSERASTHRSRGTESTSL